MITMMICAIAMVPPKANFDKQMRMYEQAEPPTQDLVLPDSQFATVRARIELRYPELPLIKIGSTVRGRKVAEVIRRRLSKLARRLMTSGEVLHREYTIGTPHAMPVRAWIEALQSSQKPDLRAWPDIYRSRGKCLVVPGTWAFEWALAQSTPGLDDILIVHHRGYSNIYNMNARNRKTGYELCAKDVIAPTSP